MRGLRKRRQLTLPLRKYAVAVIGGSIALFSLLLTHQLIWSAVAELSSMLSAPVLWLMAEGVGGGIRSVFPDRRPQQLSTNSPTQRIIVVAPPESPIAITLNGRPQYGGQQLATGRSTVYLLLRRGTNLIEASLGTGNQFTSDTSRLEIVHHPATPAAPWLLAAWQLKDRAFASMITFSVIGFSETRLDCSHRLGPSSRDSHR